MAGRSDQYRRVPSRPQMLGDEVTYPFNDGEIERARRRVADLHANLTLPEVLALYATKEEEGS